jgi:molecular chaperone GrpE
MKKTKKEFHTDGRHPEPNGPVEVHDVPVDADDAAEPVVGDPPLSKPTGSAMVEPAEEHIRRLTDELAQAKDQYLRLAADMDNFRRRMTKERSETWSRAQADVVSNILDALDDLGRVAHLDPAKTSSQDVLVGLELVERKLLKELEGAGLERAGALGEAFDPNRHEAVSTTPAQDPKQDHVISAVFQPGYRFGGALLRPAKVQVQIWSGNE